MKACISSKEEYETHICYFCKTCHREQFEFPKRNMLSEEYNWINVAMRKGVCDQTCQYALSISKKVKRRTPFDAAYNRALNKLYHYSYNAEIIFNLAMALINEAIQKDVHQIKEAEYIEYTMKLAGFNYEDKCLECYALSILLLSKNDQEEIEFGKLETKEKITTTPIYLTENQYDLRYLGKNTLVLQPKSLTKINLRIAFEIPPETIVQIASQLLLASKEINVKGGVIDARYNENITIMLQNKTDKPFRIEHAEKIAQAIYLPLINILGLQSVKNREQLGKSERRTQGFGSIGRFTVPVNIALNVQNKSHQIFQLLQPITILFFGEYHEIYTCSKPTTTQQIFESNEQICLKHEISISNVYISKGIKKFRVIFYNPNNYSIVLLNKLKIEIIHSNIFQNKNPQIVSNFIEIIRHTLLSNSNITPTTENYYLLKEKLSQINMNSLESQQQRQLKQLIAEFADIFAKNNNDLGKTDIVQHQIYTEDALPKQQQAY
ncbi:hypothetical protein G9A89_015130 [Geosiphon pyriformis]|nr:hypothetical protein G9A89_015130 [Geosiphon pyriformis]